MREAGLPVAPRVSIGFPVRNGGAMVEEALQVLLGQSFRDIEIVISDNNSDDETAEVCRAYESRDHRIRYFRQPYTISAAENFKFVLAQSASEYFAWAAHDDRRSDNYIETLFLALSRNPEASLAFSDVAVFHDHADWRRAKPEDYDFDLKSPNGYWRKIWNREYIRSGYLHAYGLIRHSAICSYEWPQIEIGPDRPILFHLSCRGGFIKAEGAVFYCYKPERRKRASERATTYYGRRLGIFPYVRLNWVCARTGCLAERLEGRRRSLIATFFTFQLAEVRKKIRRVLGAMRNSMLSIARNRVIAK